MGFFLFNCGMIKAGIVGISGYTGVELLKLLLHHRQVQVAYIASRSHAGKRIDQLYPFLKGFSNLVIEKIDIEKIKTLDVVFLALPHTVSAGIVKDIFPHVKVVDLSADFRLDIDVYERWYKVRHPAKELIDEAVYGISELNRDKIKHCSLLANPGCYATSVILALAPIAYLIDDSVIIDAKSGVSGAGKSLKESMLFCEVNENFKAYAVGSHRHVAEIEQQFGLNNRIVFTAHLLPVQRGILSTIYVNLKRAVDIKIFDEFYKSEFFIRIVDNPPQIVDVKGTNFCNIYPALIDDKRLVIVSVIDNLIKGAAGQAIQNMNIMLGLDEKEGLYPAPYYP